MIARKIRTLFLRIILFFTACFAFYNIYVFRSITSKIESIFFPHIETEIIDSRVQTQSNFIASVTGMYYGTETINNTLFIMQGQFKMPEHASLIFGQIKFALFPGTTNDSNDDRIWNQMRYVPTQIAYNKKRPNYKLILLYNGLAGTSDKDFASCPVRWCHVTGNRELALKADVVLWMHNVVRPFHIRPLKQIWAFYFLESPLHTPQFQGFDNQANSEVNWTATYRHDSTIVAPYFKYTPYDLVNPPPSRYPLPKKNYAAGKSNLIAWFVSNCASSNDRMGFAHKLQQYVPVDIYGGCGSLSCPRHQSSTCFNMLNRKYKFYLAFENSNCRDYITEKFFLNGLSNDIIPIVLGAHPDDYKRVSPPHSYIHVEEFDSIEKLANYLKYLDKNDTAYNEYFSWKNHGLVDTNTFFWCRLCMMAHEGENTKKIFPKVYDWWNGVDRKSCINANKWKDQR